MSPEEQAIHDVHTTWIAAVNAGDLDRLLTLLTDDVVLLNPSHEPLGRDGFAARFSGATQELRFHCSSDLEEVVVVGDVAYTRSKDSLTVTPSAGGETTRHAGDRMTIYRKQPDGRWLLARDMHTVLPVEE